MNINRSNLVTLGKLSPVPILVLLALAFLPLATRADTFTLDGANVDSFSFNDNSNVKTLTVLMAASDAQQFLADLQQGTKIDLLTLDEFADVNGTETLENELEFEKDLVKSFQFVTGSDMQLVDVTFSYTKFEITKGGGSGGSGGDGGNNVPEPSSVALLASGLLGLIGFGRKKLAAAL
jgi:PEP-CTERM motif